MFDNKKDTFSYILLLAFIIRLVPVISIFLLHAEAALYDGDSLSYIDMGKAASNFDFLFTGKTVLDVTIYRTPGYPLFLGIFYFLSLGDIHIALLQVVIDLVALVFIYRTAEIMFGEKAALLASVLYALNPLMIIFSFKILTENLFNFVFVITNYYFIRTLYKNEKHTLLIGILFAILSLIRPAGLLFSILYALVLFIKNRNLKEAALIVILSMSLPTLWTIRNYLYLGYFTYTGIPELNILCWQASFLANDAVDTAKWGTFIEIYHVTDFSACNKLPYETIHRGAPVATQFILDNLFLYAKHFLKAIILFFAPTTPNYFLSALGMEDQIIHFSEVIFSHGFDLGYIANLIGEKPTYLLLFSFSAFYELILYILFAITVVKAVKQKNHQSLILLMVLLFLYTVLTSGLVLIFSSYRYRMPLEIFLILFASGYYAANISVKKN